MAKGGEQPVAAGGVQIPEPLFTPEQQRTMLGIQGLTQLAAGLSAIGERIAGGNPGVVKPLDLSGAVRASGTPLDNMLKLQKVKELIAENERAGQYYGAYSPQAGGVPWTDPDTGHVYTGRGLIDTAPAGMRSALEAMGPEKGTAFLANLQFPKPSAGFAMNDAGGFNVIPGGPADPKYIEKKGGALAASKPPTTRTIQRGNKSVTQEWTLGTGWRDVAEGPKFNPKTGGPSLAQQANNEEITTARQYLRSLQGKLQPGETPREYITRSSRQASATGRANPAYDPQIDRYLRIATQRKVGDDPNYQSFISSLDKPATQSVKDPVPLPTPGQNGKIDRKSLRLNQRYTLPDGRVVRWTGKKFVEEK